MLGQYELMQKKKILILAPVIESISEFNEAKKALTGIDGVRTVAREVPYLVVTHNCKAGRTAHIESLILDALERKGFKGCTVYNPEVAGGGFCSRPQASSSYRP